MARLKTLHRRKRRKVNGPTLPRADFARFILCNRFAASSEGRSMIVGTQPGTYEYARRVYFPDAFYSIKDRIIHRFGRPAGLALQHWTSHAHDYDYNEEMEDGCDHYHVLERARLKGRIYTGHFSWSNGLSEDYKKTAGFGEMKARCVERLEGRKRITRGVPDGREAFHALKALWRRYRFLPERPAEPKPRVEVGNYAHDRWARHYEEERARRAAERVLCNGCGSIFGGLEVESIEGHDYCNGCRSALFAGREVMEEIPF